MTENIHSAKSVPNKATQVVPHPDDYREVDTTCDPSFKKDDHLNETNPIERRLSLGEHLEELRRRVIYSLLGFITSLILCLIFQEPIMKLVCYPHLKVMKALRRPETLHVLKYQESFLAYFNVSIIAALILAIPVILWQMWKFIGAGLYPHERKYVMTYLPFSFVLFIAGVLFGYFFLIPVTLKFLAGYGNPAYIQLNLTLGYYLSLFLILTLIVGLSFELPLLMLLFSALGIISPQFYTAQRKIAIVIMFIIAAVITPTTDPFTMTILALPLIGLYELGIILSRLRRTQPSRPGKINPTPPK